MKKWEKKLVSNIDLVLDIPVSLIKSNNTYTYSLDDMGERVQYGYVITYIYSFDTYII